MVDDKDINNHAKEAARKKTFQVSKRMGEAVLNARVSELTPERKRELEEIGSRVEDGGNFPVGTLSYKDLHNVALAVAELQKVEPPSYLDNSDEFAKWMTGDERQGGSDPIVISDGLTPRLQVGRLIVGLDRIRTKEERDEHYEFTITPDRSGSSAHANIAEAVHNKIQENGLSLRDTSWVHTDQEENNLEKK